MDSATGVPFIVLACNVWYGVSLNLSGALAMGLVNSVGYVHPFSSMGSELMVSPPAVYKYPEYLSNRKYLVLYLALRFSSANKTAEFPSGLFL